MTREAAMVENPPKDTPWVSPYLLVDDVDEQVDWVVDVLGFEDTGRVKGPDGNTMHAAVRAGEGLVMMGLPGDRHRTPKGLGGTTSMNYIYVDDVDKSYSRAREKGADVVEEIADQFYG
ncbi:MAG: VOC family protein, partial [Acidimicrobiales bacterium]